MQTFNATIEELITLAQAGYIHAVIEPNAGLVIYPADCGKAEDAIDPELLYVASLAQTAMQRNVNIAWVFDDAGNPALSANGQRIPLTELALGSVGFFSTRQQPEIVKLF